MGFSYLVLGSGRQGIAAAYDLGKFGDASRITLADADGERARAAADRVNLLLGGPLADAITLDVRDEAAVRLAFKNYKIVLSAVPYFFNLPLTRLAIECRVSFCDLGGNTDIVRQQHALDGEAKHAGVRVVPDCGMGPGMGNNLAAYAMSLVGHAEHVYIYDGGLPQSPTPPWNYALTFNIEGLTNEYYGGMTVLRDGKLQHIPCFTELEMMNVMPVGRLEAFFIAGGASTAPWSFEGKLKTYQLKVLRYPGTYAQLKAFSDLGLFDPKPVKVDGQQVIPRHMFQVLFEPQVRVDDARDVCIIRVRAVGRKNRERCEAVVQLMDYYDDTTNFTSMQRTTGWHLAIVAEMMARGETPLGCVPLELAVPGAAFVRYARQRGFKIVEDFRISREREERKSQVLVG